MKQFILLSISIFLFSCQSKSYDYVKMQGPIFGTFYNIIYQPIQENDQLDKGVINELYIVDWSLSTFKDTSTISVFNNSQQGAEMDGMLKKVFNTGMRVFKNTNGAFDMTVSPLVNAWGFGFKKKDSITTVLIDSLLQNVGMEMVQQKDNFLSKEKASIMLDASAIAKGFGVDVVADFLVSQGIKNYMVEIGGEIRAGGVSNKNIPWRVGIDKPIDERVALNRELQDILSLTNVGLATSGNYRNFYIKDGKKYAHTIDPVSGYPIQHSLLSASIIAPDCMTADAYATACMVMGVEKSIKVIESIPDTEGYFIYVDEDGVNQVKFTSGFNQYLTK